MHSLISASLPAGLFVWNMYLFSPKWSKRLSRNHPTVIKLRMGSVLVTCALSLMLLSWNHNMSTEQILLEIGATRFWEPLRFSKVLLLTSCPYIGCWIVAGGTPNNWRFKIEYSSLIFWRNYILSPIAEEFIYRACCVLPLLKAPSGSWYSDPWFIILFSPVLFGAAHLHHAWYQVCMKTGSAPSGLNVIWLDAMFQFCYTTIFGWYATWLYLWSECNIWCPILAHCFCNIFGLPEEGGPRGLALGLGIFVIILRFIGI